MIGELKVFSEASRGFFDREIKKDETSWRCSGRMRLMARIKHWFRWQDRNVKECVKSARVAVKADFRAWVETSQNPGVAKDSLKAAGFTKEFLLNDRPLTNRMVRRALSVVEQYQKYCCSQNNWHLKLQVRHLPEFHNKAVRAALQQIAAQETEFFTRIWSEGELAQLWQRALRAVAPQEQPAAGQSEIDLKKRNLDGLAEIGKAVNHLLREDPGGLIG